MKMPRQNGSRYVIAARRQKVAELYVQGITQFAIAEQLGVCQPTVSNDLARVREQWLKSSLMDFNAKKSEELARLEHLERVAWEDYAESRKVYVKVKGRGLVPSDTRRKPGDVRYLQEVREAITLRLKVLGAIQPDKKVIVNQNVGIGLSAADFAPRPEPAVDDCANEITQAIAALPPPAEQQIADLEQQIAAKKKHLPNGFKELNGV
jgi:predicted transcriptional regulator